MSHAILTPLRDKTACCRLHYTHERANLNLYSTLSVRRKIPWISRVHCEENDGTLFEVATLHAIPLPIEVPHFSRVLSRPNIEK